MKFNKLKLFGYALAGIGMLVANELQKRDVREAVDEALAERDAEEAAKKHNIVPGSVG